MKLAMCLAIALAAAACGRDRMDRRCEWADAPRSLPADAMRAEDVAVRYADVTAGRRSGRRAGPIEYTRIRNACLSSVFEGVARAHQVSVDEVRAAAEQRPAIFDASVLLSFGLFYLLVADRIVRWIRSRFADSKRLVAVVSGGAAGVTAAGGVLLGGVWADAAEIARIGNDHLSFRGFRIPWDHHVAALFVAGVVLFLAVSAARCAVRRARCTISG